MMDNQNCASESKDDNIQTPNINGLSIEFIIKYILIISIYLNIYSFCLCLKIIT